ncbi:hypothetical protein C7N43_03325 [Sphingobacteriales bacterium UPWRP_1]|nr:hypothetical protein BVG80_08725 [Sphingobacteriales bacterium TSM_CSM]PSJ78509.1 hypothetical protein C7N43_03325 [Sphingobacteriales bacterium UPWRP_1]
MKTQHVPLLLLLSVSLISALLLPLGAQAQKTDFNKIIQPLDVRAKDYTELLVQLAWSNNPKYEALKVEQNIAEEEIKLAQKKWTRDINASFNLNEANLKTLGSDATAENVFFPRYNLSATLNIGAFANRRSEVNIAKHNLHIAENETNQAKLQLRAEVLRRYETYLTAKELLKIRAQNVEDMYATYLLAKSNMELGKGDLKELNSASDSYNKAQENKLLAETNLRTAKINLEEIIGLKLEDIFEEKYPPKN